MPRTANHARDAARAWLEARQDGIGGYHGAYIAGSVARLAGDAPMPAGSDVDVMVVADMDGYLGKYVTPELVIEGAVLPAAIVVDVDAVLRDYHLAPGLAHGWIIDDPRGEIARAREAVRVRYADPDTIELRLADVEGRAGRTLGSVRGHVTAAAKVTAWQFGVGQLAHMVLVGGLENPTVRRRYVLAREVLASHGEAAFHERLLRLARFDALSREQVKALAADLDALLGVVGPVAEESEWRFASDIAPAMRPVVMAGIEAMIGEGSHREAMFWIVATWCRCLHLLEAEPGAGVVVPEALGVDRVRATLGVADDAALLRAVEEALGAIVEVRVVAERIAGRVGG